MTGSTIDEVNARVSGHTVPSLFLRLAGTQPGLPLLHSMKDGGGWNTWTAGDVAELTAKVAQGLLSDGVSAGERVLLMMRNRPEFHWFDLAAQFVRATPVSIYNSSSPEEIQYLASHAGARIAIIENAGFLDRLLEVRAELPDLEKIYVVDPPDGDRCPKASPRPASCSPTAPSISPASRPPPHPTTWRR